MRQDFTNFVRASVESRLDLASCEALRGALRRALRRELIRQGLWNYPPAYLGVYGWKNWSAERSSRAEIGGSSASATAGDALEELVGECYVYVFLKRGSSLAAQLKIKPSIEGLVFRNVRNFVHERQKASDPIGFRVFELLRFATCRAVADGWLHVIAGDSRIRNDTVVGFDLMARPQLPDSAHLAELAAEWANDLLPQLLTARREARLPVLAKLGDKLRSLPGTGIRALRFDQLLTPLKQVVRSRWISTFDHDLGEEGARLATVRFTHPSSDFEERDSFERLVSAVRREIGQLQVSNGTRTYLLRLWQFVAATASERIPCTEERRPSQRQIAAELGIPRERLAGLFSILRQLVRDLGWVDRVDQAPTR